MSNIAPQFKGNLGMFLVCAELSKRNLIAMPTSRNTKGHDVVVLNPQTNKAVGIQVKCTDKKNFPILNSHWSDYEEQIDEKIMADFVFVDISEVDKPRYFIVGDTELKHLLKSVVTKWGDKHGRRQGLSWKDIVEREKAEKRKPNLWALRLDHIESYEGRWETITNKLID